MIQWRFMKIMIEIYFVLFEQVTDVPKIKENYMSSEDFSYDLAAVLPLCISYGILMEIYQHSIYLITGSKLQFSPPLFY